MGHAAVHSSSAPYLPPLLTVQEFAQLVRLNPEVVRRKIRSRKIHATGRPYGIPSAELKKFGVDLMSAAVALMTAGLSKAQLQRVVRKMEEKFV